MKKKNFTSAGILMLGLSIATFAQNTEVDFNSTHSKSNNTEFNIGIADIFAKPYYIYYDSYYFSPYPQIIYPKSPSLVLGMKFHNQKGAFRTSTKLSYQKHHQENPDKPDYEFSDIKNFATTINAGYEWHSNFRKVTIFYGLDLSYGFERYKSEEENYGDIYENTTDLNKYGLSPLVGINYFITPQVSLGTEIKVNFVTFSGKEKYHSQSTDGLGNVYYSDSETKLTGSEINFGPLGYLSLNIYF